MTKEIGFDLEFTDSGVIAVSAAGNLFLVEHDQSFPRAFYELATEAGLHSRFETAELRDSIAC